MPRPWYRDPFTYAAAIAVAFTLVFPGDIGWVNDEPAFMLAAHAANARGTLASQVLRGSLGAQYSPLPIWFYQALLLVTENPIQVSVIKNVLTLALMVSGLLVLARRLELSRWPVLLVLCSPALFHWSRAIWDNNLLVPASLWLWCFTLRFWQEPRAGSFVGAAAVAGLMIHIHPMSLCLLLPWAAVLILFSAGWMRRHAAATGICLAGAGFACLPYLLSLARGMGGGPKPPPGTDRFLAGLSEPRLFTGWPIRDFVPELLEPGAAALPRALLLAAIGVSTLAFVAFGLGTIASVRALWARRRELFLWTPAERLSLLALSTIACTWAVFAATRLDAHLHHFNGVWFAYLLPAWTWVDGLAERNARLVRPLIGVHLASLAVLLLSLVAYIHEHTGTRSFSYGTTLANQMGVARTVLRYSRESAIRSSVPNVQYFPHELESLLQLLGPKEPAVGLPVADLRIHYGDDPRDARLFVTPTPPSKPSSGH